MNYPNQGYLPNMPMGQNYQIGGAGVPNGFGMPVVPTHAQPGYPTLPGFPIQNPMMSPQMMPQQQGYQYPTMNANANVYPATNMPQQSATMGMNVGSIYTGEPVQSQQSALQQHLTPNANRQNQPPAGNTYPAFFEQYTGISVNQTEQCLRQALQLQLTRIMEAGYGARVFARYLTQAGIDGNFSAKLLLNVRRITQILILSKQSGTMVEAVKLAVEIAVFGELVRELGGLGSAELTSYEMMTSTDLRTAFTNLESLTNDPQVYLKIVASHQAKFQQVVSAHTQQQQPQQVYATQPTAQPQQSLASIVVQTTGSMVDPMDILAEEVYQEKIKAAQIQQEQTMTQPSSGQWNLGYLTDPSAQTPPPPAPVAAATPPVQTPIAIPPAIEGEMTYTPLGYNVPAMSEIEKLDIRYYGLQAIGCPYPAGRHYPKQMVKLRDGTEIQTLYMPEPMDEYSADIYYAAMDQHVAHCEARHAAAKAQQVAAQPAVAAPNLQQPVTRVTTPPVQPAVHAPVAPVMTANDIPPIPVVNRGQSQPAMNERRVMTTEAPAGGTINTTPNGRVIPSAAMTNPPPNYYNFGSAVSETNLAAPTTPTGEYENDSEDHFTQLIHEREAMEAAEIEALAQQHGNPQSLSEMLDVAREKGIEVKEPELRTDYLNIEAPARRVLCRDLRIRKVPAYLKKRHNVTLVTCGDKREVVLERVKSVEYLKHETRYHSVNKYATWEAGDRGESLFVEHAKAAAEKVWSEETFVQKLNEKLEGLENQDERYKGLCELVAERPLVEIEDLITNTTSSDEYLTEVVAELNDRGVDEVGHVTDTALINYKRFNTSRMLVQGENIKLVKAVADSTNACAVVTTLQELKANSTIPPREIGRLLKTLTKHINVKLQVVFANGWSVKDAVSDYNELVDTLTRVYSNMSLADLTATLDAIYLDAVATVFHVVDDESSVEPTIVIGSVESITLMPFYYSDYALAKADDVAFLDAVEFPELIALLKAIGGKYSIIKLVTLDNVVMTFTTGAEDEFFLVGIDE